MKRGTHGNYARGIAHDPLTDEGTRVGSFATGAETRAHDHGRQRRFSEGGETLPDSPAKSVERDFAEGA